MMPNHHADTGVLRPRTVVDSIDELVVGASMRVPLDAGDGKSGSTIELVEVDGRRYVLKHLHVDQDWIARSLGDLGCRPLLVWASGLSDAAPSCIDHTVVGAAGGLGRNSWGAALLMRDVTDDLVPPGDKPVTVAQHATFLDHLAQLAARFWRWSDTIGLLPPELRWSFFGPEMLEVERGLGWPHEVPRLAAEGWEKFGVRAPRDVADLIDGLRREPWVLSAGLRDTPWTFIHGDWKMGNLGLTAGRRTVLLDWAYPGEGPICHDLAWYLALNRARLPESKEDAINRFRRSLERHGIATEGWWDRQVGLCLLGALVQFGWEKALGDQAELDWWLRAARDGSRLL